jgi:hypothetical protein
MQPFHSTWIQLLQDMAQNKAFANKMVALGIIEILGDALHHPIAPFTSLAPLVRCLVESFEDRLEILLSKICIKDLLSKICIENLLGIHNQGILEFTFLPGAFVIIKKIAMDLLANYHHEQDLFAHNNHFPILVKFAKNNHFPILVKLAKCHEEIASLIANAIATNDEMMKELGRYNFCVELLSAKFAISREKKVKGRQI